MMTTVEKIQEDILQLSYNEFSDLRRWIAELEWERWDKQIEADTLAGKLDFLFQEAENAKLNGELREL